MTEKQKIAIGMAIGIAIGAVLGIVLGTTRSEYLGRNFAEAQARIIEIKTEDVGEIVGANRMPRPLRQTRLLLEYHVSGTNIQAELVTPRSVDAARPVAILYRKANPRECIIKD